MKLSNLTAKLTCIKHNAVRALAVATLAVAALTAAAPAAQAQQFGVGVHIGGPIYGPRPVYVAPRPRVVFRGPAFYGYGYYGHPEYRRFDRWHDRGYWRR